MPHNDALYFQELFAWPDTLVRPEDEPNVGDPPEVIKQKKEIMLGKLQVRYARMGKVRDFIKDPAFATIETALMHRAKNIERIAIWDAMRKGDDAKELLLWAEHEGIIKFFRVFNNITEDMEKLKEEISNLSKPDTLTAADEVAKHIE
jgi:hypothetical protein